MGSGHFSSDAFANYAVASGIDRKTPDQVINRSNVFDEFLPRNFKGGIRESRDSVDHPKATPIIIGGDVTGSMGRLAGVLIKEALATLMTEIIEKRKSLDPAVLVAAIGDAAAYDRYPLQATQFESDIRIVEQLQQLYVEGGGGGNDSESYSLVWFMAAMMTRHDAWEKRNQKGVLFTYGDECVSEPISKARLEEVTGIAIESESLTAQDALTLANRTYDVYHLIIEEGSFAHGHAKQVKDSWQALLGERVIPVSDHTKIGEVITAIIDVRAGADKATVAKSFSDSKAVAVVENALSGLTPLQATPKTGVVSL